MIVPINFENVTLPNAPPEGRGGIMKKGTFLTDLYSKTYSYFILNSFITFLNFFL